MDVSPLDTRILRFVLEHGILDSEREIAKKLKIAPSTLSFKLRKFEHRKIITNYRYRADYTKLGLNSTAWAMLKINHNIASVKDFMDSLLEFPQVHVCLNVTGTYSVALKIYEKDKSAIREFIGMVGKKFGSAIIRARMFFAEEQLKAHNQIVRHNGKPLHIEQTDLRILSQKMQEPELSLNELAGRLGLHRNTVSNHWNRLCENSVIVKKTPIINPDLHRAIGIDFMCITLFKARQGKQSVLAEKLMRMPEVHELNKTHCTEFGLFSIIRTDNLNSYYTLCSSFYGNGFKDLIQETKSSVIIRSDSRKPTYLKDIGIEKLAS